MNFTQNGVTFKDILNAGLITGGPKISKGKYVTDNEGRIIKNMPIINAIDIDWCNAIVPGINDPITSTGQILSIIGQLRQAIGASDSDDPNSQTLLSRLAAIEESIENYATKEYVDTKIEEMGMPAGVSATIQELQEQLTEISNRVDSYHLEYSFTYSLTHIIKNNTNPLTMKKTDIVTLKFSPEVGYELPSTVNVSGATFSYNPSTGDITISNPTEEQIVITMGTNTKRQCLFTMPTLTNLTCTIISNQKTYYNVGEQFGIRIDLSNTADVELWGRPASISGTNCTITNYNSSTGEATITCSGTGNMSISATAKDVAVYRFAVALETNSIFTVSGGTITGMNVSSISSLEGAMSATGQCPVNFDSGFAAPASVDVEGAYVWFIIPSKYFNTSNFNFINGNNKYLLKQSNVQDLTTNTKIKDCVSITSGKIPYTLVCVSNNGLTGPQEFKKV